VLAVNRQIPQISLQSISLNTFNSVHLAQPSNLSDFFQQVVPLVPLLFNFLFDLILNCKLALLFSSQYFVFFLLEVLNFLYPLFQHLCFYFFSFLLSFDLLLPSFFKLDMLL